MRDTILVFTNDVPQAELIAKTLRFRGIFALPAQEVAAVDTGVRGIIAADETPVPMETLLACQLPLLALGRAAAALCAHFGGSAGGPVSSGENEALRLQDAGLFDGIQNGEYMLRGPMPLTLPAALLPIAETGSGIIGFRAEGQPVYGMQYPIEKNDPDAAQMLFNFASGICSAQDTWTEESIISEAVSAISEAVPEGLALCAVSGGADSTVCAKLAEKALGGRLRCIYVDTGLARQNEPEQAIRAIVASTGIPTAYIDARQDFLQAMTGLTDPAEKERTASRLMTRILLRQLSGDPDIHAVITGTNLNDILSDLGEKPSELGGAALLSPVRLLFKEEVRRVGTELGIRDEITHRQPFPTSGLALRILTDVTAERLSLLRRADTIFCEVIAQAGQDRRLWQYYATLALNPEYPGSYAVCLRALMPQGSAAARLPFDVMEETAERIRREIPQVRRILYDLTPSAHFGELE